MRVLFLQHGFGYGGATKSLHIMQQALDGKAEVYTFVKKNKRLNKVLSSEFVFSKQLREIDIPSVYSYSEGTIPLPEFRQNLAYEPGELIDFINKERIDVLHINSSVFSHILKTIKQKTGCKIVVHLREMLPHGKSNPVDAYILETTAAYADKIIAISPNELRFFEASAKTMVLPNPHNFESTDRLLRTANKTNKLVVGMCANFLPIKGHLFFIRAIRLVNERLKNPNVEFRIIGYPGREISLRAIVKRFLSRGYKKEVGGLIRRLGITNLALIPFTFEPLREMAQLDVYVRPDLSGNPWGRDVIEAMALKKPVIATGESEFYIRNAVNGFLVKPNDTEALAAAILQLIGDAALRNDLGAQGYQTAKEMCDMQAYGTALFNSYNRLLQRA